MSNGLVGLLCGAGFAAWIYSQMMRRTGNTKTSVYVAIGAGIICAFVIYTVFRFIFPAPEADPSTGTSGGI